MPQEDVRRKVVSLVDDWDRDHEAASCPHRDQGCIHAAVVAVRAVLELHAPNTRPGTEDTCAGCDVRGTATRLIDECTTIAALAQAMNISTSTQEPR